MAPETCVIFAHHKDDAATAIHLEELRKHNPDVFVLPAIDSSVPVKGCLPGAVDLKEIGHARGTLYSKRMVWYNADAFLYKAFRMGFTSYKRYVYLEWDCYCNCRLQDFYGPTWDADFASAARHSVESKPNWFWFNRKYAVPARYGASPLCGIVISQRALAQATEVYYEDDRWPKVMCERRIASILDMCGIPREVIAQQWDALRASRITGRWEKLTAAWIKKGLSAPPAALYHSVKTPHLPPFPA